MTRDEAEAPSSQRRDDTIELDAPAERGPWGLEVGSPKGVSFREIRAGDRIILGSARRSDLRVADRSVSGQHVRIEATETGVIVEDLGSTNGLYVGGARVGRATLAGAGCGFVAGRTTVRLRPAVELEELGECVEPIDGLVGASLVMQRLARDIRKLTRLRRPVLVQGESGSGKDVVARALHALSGRRGTFVPLNVGTIAESLADAELFGHRRGSFTGAVSARPGAFVEADGGTLFLDEIAELSTAVQVKLLRVVEDGLVRAVGGDDSVVVDVRLVTATWADLTERVEQGRFREDLFHRLSMLTLRVPPLRERLSDLPVLSEVLLARMQDEVGHKRLTAAAHAVLAAYRWPGNVRELSSALYRAAVAAPGPDIHAHHLGLRRPRHAEAESTRRLSREHALALLERFEGNVSAAARAAGVPRSTFRFWVSGRKDP
jgi:DNA-binding NtrC family response regulator